jgi:hypothetical protein
MTTIISQYKKRSGKYNLRSQFPCREIDKSRRYRYWDPIISLS